MMRPWWYWPYQLATTSVAGSLPWSPVGMRSCWPICRFFGFLMSFSRRMACGSTWYFFAARVQTFSPFCSTWMVSPPFAGAAAGSGRLTPVATAGEVAAAPRGGAKAAVTRPALFLVGMATRAAVSRASRSAKLPGVCTVAPALTIALPVRAERPTAFGLVVCSVSQSMPRRRVTSVMVSPGWMV